MWNYREQYQRWLDSPALSEAEWKELSDIAEDEKEIESRFFAPLEFGTAGLRGVMGMGTRRMNIHVIRWVTQAFARVILAQGEAAAKKGVVICYDCRTNSDAFAREAARVMVGSGVHVRLFEAMRPTPELSFAIRHYAAQAGINITASHNTKEYNGYKVYWADGAQLPPAQAAEVALAMEEIDLFTGVSSLPLHEAEQAGLLEYLGAETDEAFLAKALSQAIDPQTVARAADRLAVVYTPFHGAGYRLVPEALGRLGLKRLVPEPRQSIPDGSFPTVVSPNPEKPEGFYLAEKLAAQVDSDLIIGTDPDADRVAVMVRTGDDRYEVITGNQLGELLLDYIITARKEKGTLPANAVAITTIVSTGMVDEICRRNGVRAERTFTGFKFMAERIAELERTGSGEYIFAFEESCGYMMGDFVRDKDAVTASVLITEMAARYALEGLTLADALERLYAKYGLYRESTIELVMPGLDGLEKMNALMDRLRRQPPEEIGGAAVVRERDYESGTVTVPGLGPVEHTEIFGSNVLYFELDNGTDFIVRPSGTEPKIKIYILTKGDSEADCQEKIDRCAAYAQSLRQ